jgi:hypothetical protein
MLVRNRSIERLEGARQSCVHLVDYLPRRRCRQAHKPTARYLPLDSGNLNTGVPFEDRAISTCSQSSARQSAGDDMDRPPVFG